MVSALLLSVFAIFCISAAAVLGTTDILLAQAILLLRFRLSQSLVCLPQPGMEVVPANPIEFDSLDYLMALCGLFIFFLA